MRCCQVSFPRRFCPQGRQRSARSRGSQYLHRPDVRRGRILSVGTLANGGATSSIGQSTNAAANLTFYNGGILQYTGPTASTDRSFTLNIATGSGGGFEIAQAGTALTISGAGAGSGQMVKTGYYYKIQLDFCNS